MLVYMNAVNPVAFLKLLNAGAFFTELLQL
jgi:hypothetical protein